MTRTFAARVGAAGRLLASLHAPPPSFDAASADQRGSLIAALVGTTYSAEDAATMVDDVKEVGFCARDADQFFAVIHQHVEGGRGVVRSALQNYTAIHLYDSAAFWNDIS